MIRTWTNVALFSLFAASSPATYASQHDDSLHVELAGQSTAADRARAMLVIAAAQARSQPAESLQKVAMATQFAEQSGDRDLLHRAVCQQRDLERAAGAQDQFLLSAIRAVSIAQRMSDRNVLADDLRNLCEAYEWTGSYDKAIELRHQVLFLLKSTGDEAATGKAITEMINTLVLAGRFDDVLSQSKEALAFYVAHNDQVGEANVWLSQGEALLAQRRGADALPTLSRAERVFRSMGMTSTLTRTLEDLAEAQILLNRWQDARVRLDEALSLAGTDHTSGADPRSFALASRIHEGLGEDRLALGCERRYVALKDSLYKDRIAQRMMGLQALYSAGRKELEYSQLRVRNEANENTIAEGRLHGRWWLAAFAVVLSGAVLMFLMARNQRRLVRRARLKNQVIQRQSQEIKTKNLELERQNLRLAESLMNEEEKDLQLKEIHHRVKNNLQIVNTLLMMQGNYMKDPALEEVMGDCQGRVRSMALVHEHIYRCGDLARVNVKAHLFALAAAIMKQYGLKDRVEVDLNVNYDRASLDNLMPLSLLINELLTNSAKHAFGGREDGRITIILRRMGEQQCELVYSDNGVGMRQEHFFHQDSFGLELVRTLATQLDGRIRLLKGEGTTFQMTFEPQVRAMRKAS